MANLENKGLLSNSNNLVGAQITYRGPKGDKGDKGDKGNTGEPGYTPIKGIDYYTLEEKQTLIDEVTNNVNTNIQPFIDEQTKKINDAVSNINDLTESYNTNAINKTNEFNSNSDTKLAQYNNNANEKITEYNNNALSKSEEYNTNASNKVNEYNQNAESLINRLIETELENARLREDLNGLPTRQASGESIDLSDSAEMRCDLKISGNSVQNGEPTPDTSVEVECCGDNINLFDKNDITNNTSIDVRNGNTYTDNNSFSTNFIKINGITELCCNGLSDTSKLWGAIYDENKSYIKGINTTNGIFNETNLSGATYIRLGLLKTYLDTMKLEKGSIPTQYSPYGQGCINEVICNKNLANIEKFNITTGTGTTYPKTIQGLKENTEYTISFYKSRIAGATISNTAIHGCRRIHFYRNEEKLSEYIYNSPVSDFSSGNKKFEIRITTPAKCNKVICYFDNANGDNNINTTVYDIQLEEGTTATAFEEHKSQTYSIPTQQPFRAIGDTRDTFIKKNNKWYERHYINRLILNGTESWEMIGTNTTGKYRFQTKVSPNEIVNNQDGDTYMQGFCNRLIMGTPNTTYLCQTGITTLSGYLIIYNEKATDTIDNFKAWLSSNNLTVDYLLKTPIDIECTEEQSTILFDIEQNAKTYDKVTHMYSTDKISSYKEVTYKKDIETLFANTLVEGV